MCSRRRVHSAAFSGCLPGAVYLPLGRFFARTGRALCAPRDRVRCVHTDNGFEFTNRFSNSRRDKQKQLERTAAELGVRHEPIRSYTPRRNGKAERRHREEQKCFYFCHSFYSLNDFQKQLTVHLRRSNSCPSAGPRQTSSLYDMFDGTANCPWHGKMPFCAEKGAEGHRCGQVAPRPENTAGTVKNRILRSVHRPRSRIYLRSSSIHSSKPISFRPLICQ